ncbi:MAG TPA: cytochrome c [Albitalea sp.]|uniref:c-type cytochrome n=1 Tax=Piscinibacter sp. TaxID=1903157 RepID=UPI002ED26A96
MKLRPFAALVLVATLPAGVVAADKTWTLAELKARGAGVYQKNCAACHQPKGQGIPSVFPALDGSAVVTGPKVEHIRTVLNGRPGTGMLPFAARMSDIDVAAVITFERNAWGNKTGEAVQPADVKSERKR